MKVLSPLTILLVALTIGFPTKTKAQNLKRKGMLGIMMQTLTDSIASQYQLEINKGVYINTVIPNSTFSNLGVKQGDVLTNLNGTPINTIQDVLSIASGLYEGDKIEAKFLSDNKEKYESTSTIGRPKEVFDNASVTHGEVVYKDNALRSILVTPTGIKKAPVIYFLQGYTCGSVETATDDNPMKKLLIDWVDAGYAVYRIEKPGVGDSRSKRRCTEITFEEELRAFEEGYKDLLSNKSIDTENIFLFGHSMGGVIAPLLINVKSPRGILTYGSVGDNWYDYMIDLYTIQPKYFGVSDAQIKEDNKVNLKFNTDLLINKLSGAEILQNKAYADFFSGNEFDFKNNQYIGRHFSFWQSLADIDIPDAWSQVTTNVLAMYGEYDIQAINAKGSKRIADLVSNNGGKGEFMLVKKADHGFVNFNSMRHNVETLGSGDYMNHARENYCNLLGDETIKWMNSKLKV